MSDEMIAAADASGPPLTIREAAEGLGICLNAAYAAAHRGEIPVIRIGRRLLVPRPAFSKLLAGGVA